VFLPKEGTRQATLCRWSGQPHALPMDPEGSSRSLATPFALLATVTGCHHPTKRAPWVEATLGDPIPKERGRRLPRQLVVWGRPVPLDTEERVKKVEHEVSSPSSRLSSTRAFDTRPGGLRPRESRCSHGVLPLRGYYPTDVLLVPSSPSHLDTESPEGPTRHRRQRYPRPKTWDEESGRHVPLAVSNSTDQPTQGAAWRAS
jgi:hypothetical protein